MRQRSAAHLERLLGARVPAGQTWVRVGSPPRRLELDSPTVPWAPDILEASALLAWGWPPVELRTPWLASGRVGATVAVILATERRGMVGLVDLWLRPARRQLGGPSLETACTELFLDGLRGLEVHPLEPDGALVAVLGVRT